MASPTKYLKGECTHCGGHVEFPAEAAGMTVECPHCRQQTELLLAQPEEHSGIPRSVILWTAITIFVLLACLGAALYAVKRAERMAKGKKGGAIKIAQAVEPTPTNAAPASTTPESVAKADFRISEITLDKTKGSSLTYAVGTLENLAAKTRYGVKVQFEVLNSEGKKIGTASDYKDTIEPNTKWNFRALVVESKAASVKATDVSEQQ